MIFIAEPSVVISTTQQPEPIVLDPILEIELGSSADLANITKYIAIHDSEAFYQAHVNESQVSSCNGITQFELCIIETKLGNTDHVTQVIIEHGESITHTTTVIASSDIMYVFGFLYNGLGLLMLVLTIGEVFTFTERVLHWRGPRS